MEWYADGKSRRKEPKVSGSNMLKKICVLPLAAAMLVSLSGCLFISSTEDLYSMPKLPEQYVELDAQIKDLLASGCEYAAPTSGDNIQSIQLIDLDGDGTAEAVACFRNNTDEKPLKIYIYQVDGTNYVQKAIIEGSGTAIDRIDFADLNGDGEKEIVVGWKMSTEKAMTVYAMRGGEATDVMEAAYTKYILADLNGDGRDGLVTVRSDNNGGCTADLYRWNGDSEELTSSAKLSMSPSGLSSAVAGLTTGSLADGSPALFVSGAFDDIYNVTDVLRLKDGALVNITMNERTGVSGAMYINRSLLPVDINGDGVTEVPSPKALRAARGQESTYWEIRWLQYDGSGQGTTVETTYHNITDGWYIKLPDAWTDNIMITRVETTSNQRAVTFAYIDGSGKAEEFMTISSVTGDSRESIASRGNRFILRTRTSAIYTAEFLPANSGWSGAISEDELKDAFSLIQKAWKTGE
jgi:hypothetical protein